MVYPPDDLEQWYRIACFAELNGGGMHSSTKYVAHWRGRWVRSGCTSPPLLKGAIAISCAIVVLEAGGMNAVRVALWLDALGTATQACRHSAQSPPSGAMVAMVRCHPHCRDALAQAA